jgi:hypothetical protein
MDQSIQITPEFYYGLIAVNAGYIFAGQLSRNHSHQSPEGLLSKNNDPDCDWKTDKRIAKEIVGSFFAIHGEEGHLTYCEGWEMIPQN